MSWFKKKEVLSPHHLSGNQSPTQGVNILQLRASEVSEQSLASLAFPGQKTQLIFAFISANLEFESTIKKIQACTPFCDRVVGMMTAGELNSQQDQFYQTTDGAWDSIVLQSFSETLFSQVEIKTIPLHCEDLKQGRVDMNKVDRLKAIQQEIEALKVDISVNYQDTVAMTFMDGLSSSENFFMKALYDSKRFPCHFIGGSAGGKLDFKQASVYDGQMIADNSAVVIFAKLAKEIRYGILKTHNFEKTPQSFYIAEANAEKRTVTSVISKSSGKIVNIVDHLCEHFGCSANALNDKLTNHSFAVEIGEELFIRSIANIDVTNKVIHFFSDLDFGDELILVAAKPFADSTKRAFDDFMQGKPKPIAMLANDCILRRLNNASELNKLTAFQQIKAAGFSTFGELLGVHMNQTLTALFFFKVEAGQSFSDPVVDNFPIHYSYFKEFFTLSKINSLSQINRLQADLIRYLSEYRPLLQQVLTSFNQITNYSQQTENIIHNVSSTFGGLKSDIDAQEEGRKALGNNINQLRDNSEQVMAILKVISGIADQTNLLALNAAIEAARAGEAGRGFAVVADEVRQLSKNTQDSLDKTGETISSVTESTGSISQSIEHIEGFMSRLIENTQALTGQIDALGEASNVASQDVNNSIQAIENMTERMAEIDHEVTVIENLKRANDL